jgi:DNA polymerase-3 subunit alpha (Gram-positive type)
MNRKLEDLEFIIFDTETTGLDPESGDRIVEIAALKFKGAEKISNYESLVNPKREISPAAFEVNKITTDMLGGARTMDEVMPEFLEFIQGSCLCSYNVSFDLGFINNELKIMQREPLKDILIVDILRMSKKLMPHLERYALWFVAKELGIQYEQKHRAQADVELAHLVFHRLNKRLLEKGILDFDSFFSLFGMNNYQIEDINNQKIAKIQEALDLGIKLKIKYLSSSEAKVSEREIIPQEIRQERGHSYLVGFCCLRNDKRTFRIDNILNIE